MINFKNKKVLITGATGGIGLDLVKKFTLLDANVLATGTKTEKLDLLKKKYPNIKVKKFDLSEHSRIEEFIDNVSLELGGLDILINNAGLNMDNLSLRMKDEEWSKVINVNLTSTKKNITVNCVSPGFIVSNMTMNIAEKVKLYLTSRIPMGKLGSGEDVSNSVAFLSSDQASYITGETIHVNGGMYMA